jgi:hypothetical protein
MSHRASQIAFWIAVIATLLASAVLMAYRINEPLWERGHHGYMMTEYPHNAVNYVRFGYLGTRLGLAMNYGPVVPDDGFDCRTDHPILSAFVISIMYRLVGISEWASRLPFVLLALGGSLATSLLAVKVFGGRWPGLMALILCALSPATLFWGRMPDSHTIAVSVSMLVFLLYWMWFTTARRAYLVGLYGAFAVSANIDWNAYFAAPAILLHHIVFARPRSSTFIARFAALPFVLVAVYIAFAFAIKGTSTFHEMWSTLLFRTLSIRDGDVYAFTWQQYWTTFGDRADYWLTTPVLLLGSLWVLKCVALTARRRLSAQDGLIASVILFGLSFNLVFPNLVFIHDFAMIYQFVPALALAAASIVTTQPVGIRRTPALAVGSAAAMVVCGLFLRESIETFRREHAPQPPFVGAYYVGQALRDTVSPAGAYVDAAHLAKNDAGMRAYVTADRPFIEVDTLGELTEARMENSRYEAVVLDNAASGEAELAAYLVESFHGQNVFGHSIFDLTRPGSSVLVDNPRIARPVAIRFGSSLEFLGFEVETFVTRRDDRLTLWDTYLNRHAALAAPHRTAFRVVNYWRKLGSDPANYTLMTRFVADGGSGYELKPQYAGLDVMYPTSRWPVQRVVRDDFQVDVPASAPSVRYGMYLQVKQGSTTVAAESNEPPGPLRLADVEVRPSSLPVGLASEPAR